VRCILAGGGGDSGRRMARRIPVPRIHPGALLGQGLCWDDRDSLRLFRDCTQYE